MAAMARFQCILKVSMYKDTYIHRLFLCKIDLPGSIIGSEGIVSLKRYKWNSPDGFVDAHADQHLHEHAPLHVGVPSKPYEKALPSFKSHIAAQIAFEGWNPRSM